MSQDFSPELDHLDLQIIKEMEVDGRQSISELARKLEVGRPVAARKLQRLLDEHIIRVVALSAPAALGYQTQVLTGINVQPGEVNDVAERLEALNSIHLVVTIAGRQDIFIWALFRDPSELSSFLSAELAKTPGMASTETLIVLDMKKISFAYLASDDDFYQKLSLETSGQASYPVLDQLDMDIIKELEADGRLAVSDISAKLGYSRPTIHAKLQRLLEHRCIKVVALARPRSMGFQTMALVGINVRPIEIDIISKRLATYPNVHMVATTAGRFDIMIMTLFHNSTELSEFLRAELGGILNVTSAETMVMMDVKKLSLSFFSTDHRNLAITN